MNWPSWKKRREGKQRYVYLDGLSRLLRTRIYLSVDFGSEAVAFADRDRQEDVAAAFCGGVFGKG
jgi:hypothetical protein